MLFTERCVHLLVIFECKFLLDLELGRGYYRYWGLELMDPCYLYSALQKICPCCAVVGSRVEVAMVTFFFGLSQLLDEYILMVSSILKVKN